MKTFTIFIHNRPEARRFLSLSKKHTLFKDTNPVWDSRKITYNFKNEEEGGIIADVIKAVLYEMQIEYEVV